MLIPDPDFPLIPDPGSRGQKSTEARIRIRSTGEDISGMKFSWYCSPGFCPQFWPSPHAGPACGGHRVPSVLNISSRRASMWSSSGPLSFDHLLTQGQHVVVIGSPQFWPSPHAGPACGRHRGLLHERHLQGHHLAPQPQFHHPKVSLAFLKFSGL